MSLFDYATVVSLYEDASRYDEFATNKFWGHIFSKAAFPGMDWVVSHEQPPKKTHDLRRIDIQIEYGEIPTVVMFVELKKIRATLDDVLQAQRQVAAGCQTYCREHGLEFLWAMSCYGPNFRLWVYSSSTDRLKPVYPNAQEDNSRGPYLDFKDFENELMSWFGVIKKNPRPDDELLDMYVDVNLDNLDLEMSDTGMALDVDDPGAPGPAAPTPGSSLQMEYGQAELDNADSDPAPGRTAPSAGSSSQRRNNQPSSSSAPTTLLPHTYTMVGIGGWDGDNPNVGSVDEYGNVTGSLTTRPLRDWQAAQGHDYEGQICPGWVVRGSTGTLYFCPQDIWHARKATQEAPTQAARGGTKKKHKRQK